MPNATGEVRLMGTVSRLPYQLLKQLLKAFVIWIFTMIRFWTSE